MPADEDGDYVNLLFDDPKKVHHEYIDGGAQPDVEWVQKDVRPFKVFHMHFEGLLPGQPYGIFIPELFGGDRQGFFRTFKEWTRESEAVFMGQNALAGLPVVNNILTQMKLHQIADLRHLVREMQFLFGSKIAALYSTSGRSLATQRASAAPIRPSPGPTLPSTCRGRAQSQLSPFTWVA